LTVTQAEAETPSEMAANSKNTPKSRKRLNPNMDRDEQIGSASKKRKLESKQMAGGGNSSASSKAPKPDSSAKGITVDNVGKKISKASLGTPSKKKPNPIKGRPSSAKKRPFSAKRRDQILAKRAKEADAEPKWPARARFYKAWHDEAFDEIRKVLDKRGWTDLGNVCDMQNCKELSDIAASKTGSLPRRCLWWVHEDDARRLSNLPKESMSNARHCISTFLGTDAAVTKVAITEMNNDEPWYPKAFVLPREADQLLKYAKAKKQKYWIAKPRNEYAGRGVRVFNTKSKEFKECVMDKNQKEFVIQSYLEKPLLVGGFKFHFRMYTVLTGILDNFEAYLYKDGHALFSTKEYTINDNTLGKDFDPFIHLTNWSINFVKGNEDLARDKNVIGVGCEWAVGTVLKEIKRCHPKFDLDAFWKEMTELCAISMYKIAQWKNVKRHRVENDAHPRFENFGMDVMMDDQYKIWLMEANTQVGLNSVMANFPDKKCTRPSWKTRKGNEVYCTPNGCIYCRGGRNVRATENNKVLDDVINTSLSLMQLDVPARRRVSRNLIPLHTVMNDEIMAKKTGLAPRRRSRSVSRGRRLF